MEDVKWVPKPIKHLQMYLLFCSLL